MVLDGAALHFSGFSASREKFSGELVKWRVLLGAALTDLRDVRVRQAAHDLALVAVVNLLLLAERAQALGALLFVDVLLPRPPREHLAGACNLVALRRSLPTRDKSRSTQCGPTTTVYIARTDATVYIARTDAPRICT